MLNRTNKQIMEYSAKSAIFAVIYSIATGISMYIIFTGNLS